MDIEGCFSVFINAFLIDSAVQHKVDELVFEDVNAELLINNAKGFCDKDSSSIEFR